MTKDLFGTLNVGNLQVARFAVGTDSQKRIEQKVTKETKV
jgi:hypothetical protein